MLDRFPFLSLCAPHVQKLNLKGLAERSERMGILLRDELATLPSSIVKQVLKDISIGEVDLS